jgi:hypothetical protein
MAGRQRMLSQKMSKEFLMVANPYGMFDATAEMTRLDATMTEFDAALGYLMVGNAAKNIAAAPNDEITTQLGVVKGLWTTFYKLLLDNKDTITAAYARNDASATTVLEAVADQSVPLLKNMNKGVGMIAKAAGLAAPGAVVNVAGRQRMLSQKMAKEALLVGLGIKTDAMIISLAGSKNLFEKSHLALLNGNVDDALAFSSPPQLQPVADPCIKRQLEIDVYANVATVMFEPIASIIETGIANEARLRIIADQNVPLLVNSNKAVKMYVSLGNIGVACHAPKDGGDPKDGGVPGSGCTSPEDPLCVLTGLQVAEEQVEYMQKMTRAYVEVAKGVHAYENRKEVMNNIEKFDNNLHDLLNGNKGRNVLVTPPQFAVDLASMQAHWDQYSALLRATKDTVGSESTDVLGEVERQQNMMVVDTTHFLEKWKGYATFSTVTLPPAKQMYAKVQRVYIQKLVTEVMFESLDIKKSDYAIAQAATATLFEKTMTALTEGSIVSGLPKMKKVCPLFKLYEAKAFWATLNLELTKLRRNQNSEIDEPLVQLETRFVELYQILLGDITVCNIEGFIDDNAWFNMVEIVFKTRIDGQAAMRTYYELAKGVQMNDVNYLGDADYNKEHLKELLDSASHEMHVSVVGDVGHNIPTPPSQEVMNAILHAEATWFTLSEALKLNVAQNDYSPSSLKMISTLGAVFSNEMADVGHQLVTACKAATPHQLSSVWELTERQLELVQEAAGEALLVNLGVEAEAHKASFLHTVELFEASHWKLLLGPADPRLREGHRRLAGAVAGGSDLLLTDDTIPATKDACTLKAMRNVMVQFEQLSKVLYDVSGNDTAKAATALQSMESSVAAVETPCKTAIDFYHYSGLTCAATVLPKQAWESSLQTLGEVAYIFQHAVTEFALMALPTEDDETGRDFSTTWLDNSAHVLAEHRGFIQENVKDDPALVGAMELFKTSWASFRGTDEERLLGLQVAYITLNPHPTGSKDLLDYAPGPEEYHAVHKEFHTKYRNILLAKDYYDIFMLGSDGNCIYSVYKELDYATNFLPDGIGEWKDSGLGEAYVAAMANPDNVNIIDWKPYGPSNGAQASFLSMGVRNSIGTIIGVYCTQLPPASIPRDSAPLLAAAIKTTDDYLWDFRFGKPSLNRPAPPTQMIADRLFEVVDRWHALKPLLEGTRSPAALEEVIALVNGFDFGGLLMTTFTDVVAASAPTLPTQQISVGSQQLALVQTMFNQAIWVVRNGGSTAALAASMGNFSRLQHELTALGLDLGGESSRRLAASAIDAKLTQVQTSWDALQPLLQGVVDSSSFGTGTPSQLMLTFVSKTADVTDSVMSSYDYVASTTRTTTLQAVHILAPMPFTGSWSGGATMRVAALFAERLINTEQIILPGYDLAHRFFDDKCDGRESSRIVLEEMNKDDTYVALGGAACSQACAQSTFVASTLKLPFIGYQCASADLSDSLAYPGLTRFGTVTTATPMYEALDHIGKNYSWQHIILLSADDEESRGQAQLIQTGLEKFFSVENILGIARDFDQLTNIFAKIKESTRGKQRNVFVVGSETFYRKLLCAAVKAEAKEGITWISQGTWREDWFNKSDTSYSFQISWLVQEATSARVVDAIKEFSAGWDEFGATDNARRDALQDLYITSQGLDLYSIPGDETYHVAHTKYHSEYHRELFDRNYYDIFMFDPRGNLIYSVYKESDYATNFHADGSGAWKDSGLGEAFRIAWDEPDKYHYIDWAPYGPSGYADAAFFSHGVKNSTGHRTGVYCIQLPPTYEQSVDKQHPDECALSLLAASYEGAINIAGLGKPLEEDIEKKLSCFKGHSARSFYFELDGYLESGYPGVPYSDVPAPYNLIRGNAADATCLVAYTLKHFLSLGHSLEELQHPTEVMYDDIQEYIKNHVDFAGATGRVKFDDNDKPNNLLIQQVRGGHFVDVGVIDVSGNRTWMNGGVTDSVWQNEHLDPPPPQAEEFNLFVEVILPFFFVIIPILLLLALSPLLCLVVIFIFKSCAGRMGNEGGGGDGRA